MAQRSRLPLKPKVTRMLQRGRPWRWFEGSARSIVCAAMRFSFASLLVSGALLAFAGCGDDGEPADTGTVDTGAPDTGMPDTSMDTGMMMDSSTDGDTGTDAIMELMGIDSALTSPDGAANVVIEGVLVLKNCRGVMEPPIDGEAENAPASGC